MDVLSWIPRQSRILFFILYGGVKVPEIRATVDVQLHRRLKEEAAREGMHLKQLIAKILEDHSKNSKGGSRERK
jgi:hypothetical protein